MNKTSVQRFKNLSKIAGEKFLEIDYVKKQENIINESDPEIRWYKGIKFLLDNSFESKFPGQMLDEDDNVIGYIYTGSIYNIAEQSSNLCLKMISEEKKNKEEYNFFKKIWEKYAVGIIITVIGGVLVSIIIKYLL